MPHERKRYIEQMLAKALKSSKTVSLIGLRQVGKTTLLKQHVRDYISFDDDQYLKLAENTQWSFIDQAALPAGLDECQKCPAVFDRVKLQVDLRKMPGQYILSGSVRFLAKKQIRESLTGRTVILELLPFNLSEAHQLPMNSFYEIILSKRPAVEILAALKQNCRFKESELLHYGKTGGLPGICFKRDSSVRDRAYDAQVETILSRDIDFIAPTKLGYRKLRNLLTLVYRQAGLPVNQAALARELATSKPTVKRLLDAFEQLFLIRKHGNTYYPVDLGLSDYLVNHYNLDEHKHALRLVYSELYAQIIYGSHTRFEFVNYTTRGGSEIPFIVDLKEKGKLALVVDTNAQVSDKSQIGLTRYKKANPKVSTVILYRGAVAYQSHSGHLCLPLHWVF